MLVNKRTLPRSRQWNSYEKLNFFKKCRAKEKLNWLFVHQNRYRIQVNRRLTAPNAKVYVLAVLKIDSSVL